MSEEEKNNYGAKLQESLEKVGGKELISCVSVWASGQWMMFGIEEYPDVEAVQKHAEALFELGQFRYVDSVTLLGTKWEPQ